MSSRGRKTRARNPAVTFLPYWPRNPYQKQLSKHLSMLGVPVPVIGRTISSIIRGLVQQRPAVLHLHWLHPFYEARHGPASVFQLAVSLAGLLALKLLGMRIVWTAHNLKHHEDRYPRLDRTLTSFVVRCADAIIVHCATAKHLLVSEFRPGNHERIFVVPHGHYIDAYENRVDRAQARGTLGVSEDAVVLLFLGQLRPYKGVLELVDAFKRVDCPDGVLLIAGKPLTDDSARIIRRRIGDDARITFLPGFVPNDRMQVYLNACDAVVMPYRDVLTSGIAVLAMSFGRACVAPRIGCINDLLDHEGAFLYDSHDPDGLLRALQETTARRTRLSAMGAYNRRAIEQFGWNGIARQTLDVYRRICSTPAHQIA